MTDKNNIEEEIIEDEFLEDISKDEIVEKTDLDLLEEYKAGWQRAQADYKNLQVEVSTQRSEWARMSKLYILEEFIPVYDNFKKAFANEPVEMTKEQENWVKGVGYIKQQFGKVLSDNGVEEIETVGKMFDASMHEAVGEEENKEEDGTIICEIEGGYKMGEKVVKVAKVIVSKKEA